MKAVEIPQLKTASVTDKLELIDDIWASIPADKLEPLQSHILELESRLEKYKDNPEYALSPVKARQRLNELTGL